MEVLEESEIWWQYQNIVFEVCKQSRFHRVHINKEKQREMMSTEIWFEGRLLLVERFIFYLIKYDYLITNNLGVDSKKWNIEKWVVLAHEECVRKERTKGNLRSSHLGSISSAPCSTASNQISIN